MVTPFLFPVLAVCFLINIPRGKIVSVLSVFKCAFLLRLFTASIEIQVRSYSDVARVERGECILPLKKGKSCEFFFGVKNLKVGSLFVSVNSEPKMIETPTLNSPIIEPPKIDPPTSGGRGVYAPPEKVKVPQKARGNGSFGG